MLSDRKMASSEAYSLLAKRLCDAMSEFIENFDHVAGEQRLSAPKGSSGSSPVEAMTLRQVQAELCLSKDQIVKLTRRWGFPAPLPDSGGQAFDRKLVDRWVMAQPNPANLAAVLRLKKSGLVVGGSISRRSIYSESN